MARSKTTLVLSAEDKTKRAFSSVQKNLRGATRAIGKMSTALGLVSGGGLLLLGKQALDSADKIQKLSTRLGISTEALSELEHASKLSGVSFETTTMAMQRMIRRVAEAANGTGEAVKALDEMNISAAKLKELAPDQQFEVLADALMSVKNPADQVRLAMKLFDSEGVSLIQMMQGGSAGLREMREEARSLGLTLSQDAADSAAKAQDQIARMQASTAALSRSFAMNLGPALVRVTGFIGNQMIPAFGHMLEKMGLIRREASQMSLGELGMQARELEEEISDVTRALDAQERAAARRKKLGLQVDPTTIDNIRALKAQIDGLFSELGKVAGRERAMADAVVEASKSASAGAAAAEGYSVSLDGLSNATAKATKKQKELKKVFGAAAPSNFVAGIMAAVQAAKDYERAMVGVAGKVRSAIETNVQEFVRLTEEAKGALKMGLLSQGEFNDYVDMLRTQLINPTKEATEEMSVYSDQAARNMQDAFADFLFDPFDKGLKGMLKSFVDTIRRMLANQAAKKVFAWLGGMGKGGGGNGGGIFASIGKLFGFAHGGAFTVGGTGGTDSKVVAFRATPGERVSVETPHQQKRGERVEVVAMGQSRPADNRSVVINNHIDARGATMDLAEALPKILADHGRQIQGQIFDAMQRGMVPS